MSANCFSFWGSLPDLLPGLFAPGPHRVTSVPQTPWAISLPNENSWRLMTRWELSMGPTSSTQRNPTHQMTDPTQPNLYHSENLDPGPNPIHNLDMHAKHEAWPLVSINSVNIKYFWTHDPTQSTKNFKKISTQPNPTQPLCWPNPRKTLYQVSTSATWEELCYKMPILFTAGGM